MLLVVFTMDSDRLDSIILTILFSGYNIYTKSSFFVRLKSIIVFRLISLSHWFSLFSQVNNNCCCFCHLKAAPFSIHPRSCPASIKFIGAGPIVSRGSNPAYGCSPRSDIVIPIKSQQLSQLSPV